MLIISPSGQVVLGSHHELHGGSGLFSLFTVVVFDQLPETVIYVHHGQPGVGLEVALVHPRSQGIMEYLDCIIRSPSSRVGVIGNNTREPGMASKNINLWTECSSDKYLPQTSKVQVEPLVIIFS